VRIDVTGGDLVLTKAFRTGVRRRVLLAMSRFGRELHGVTVRLAESPNPLGGFDQRCRVRVQLRSGVVLRAEAVNGELEAAVGRSAARLARLVAAALDGGGGGQGPPPPLGPRRSDG
jgi:ribosome-associated translation inhibitor RaiA